MAERHEVDYLVSLARGGQICPEELDDLVYDLAQEVDLDDLNGIDDEDAQEEHIATRERYASCINNGGLALQIEFLTKHKGPTWVEALLRRLPGE